MNLSGPVGDWQVKRNWKPGIYVGKKPQLRRPAAGTRGCCQAGCFPFRLLEVVACELGVLEGEPVLGHAGGRQGWRAAGQMEVVEDLDDNSGVGERNASTRRRVAHFGQTRASTWSERLSWWAQEVRWRFGGGAGAVGESGPHWDGGVSGTNTVIGETGSPIDPGGSGRSGRMRERLAKTP